MPPRVAADIYPMPRCVETKRGRFGPGRKPLTLRLASGAPKWVRAAAGMAAAEIGRTVGRKVVVASARGAASCTATVSAERLEAAKSLGPQRGGPPGTAEQAYELEIEPDQITVWGSGWAGLAYGLMTLLDTCAGGLRCRHVSDAPRFGIRAMLLHLSYNQWRHTPSKELVYGFSDRLRFDKRVFDEAVMLMARLRMNMVVLRALLAECRNLGIEPIPKLNFATTHDAWLKEYGMMVGTDRYNAVCDDLIAELTDLFNGPRFFHIGMDEETIHHCRGLQLEHVILREGKVWLDAVKRLDRSVRRCGARTWMWGDPLWPAHGSPPPDIPRRILLSDWNYAKRTSFPTSSLIEKLGYDNIPAGANWTEDENIALLARFAARRLTPKKNPGMLMTVWNPTVAGCRGNILNAISLAAGAAWNPDGPSRAPWPRDHYGGRWRQKTKP
jgi:hypothetical protein